MPRYIDADALIEMLNNKSKTDLEMGLYNHHALTESFIRFVERQPTADVVPKSEVEKLKIAYEGSQKAIKGLTEMIREKDKELAKLETHLELHYGEKSLNNLIAKEKAEVAREIFEEIEKALNLSKCYGESGIYFEHDIEADIADLKKKYI